MDPSQTPPSQGPAMQLLLVLSVRRNVQTTVLTNSYCQSYNANLQWCRADTHYLYCLFYTGLEQCVYFVENIPVLLTSPLSPTLTHQFRFRIRLCIHHVLRCRSWEMLTVKADLVIKCVCFVVRKRKPMQQNCMLPLKWWEYFSKRGRDCWYSEAYNSCLREGKKPPSDRKKIKWQETKVSWNVDVRHKYVTIKKVLEGHQF